MLQPVPKQRAISFFYLQVICSLLFTQSPADILHVGDDMNLDIVGAHSFGLKPILLDRRSKWTHENLVSFCKARAIPLPHVTHSLDTITLSEL
jgi:FMN phosphatase YigB (HAD superfamily)